MSIVAIVSNLHRVGEEIAAGVAERLEYTPISELLMEVAAKQYNTTVKKLNRALAGDRSLFNALTHDYEKSVVYIKAAMADLLAKDELVYHGPATYLIPLSDASRRESFVR